jgi:heme/copper-type cytochrome/quinol oxidase subunit 2
MFENLMVIVVIVVILWLVGFAVYLYASRQQQDLTAQIEDLRQLLNGEGEDAEG